MSYYELLTKSEIKMAGYWPNSLFASLWTEIQKLANAEQEKIQPSSPNKLGQYRVYYMAFPEVFLAGRRG